MDDAVDEEDHFADVEVAFRAVLHHSKESDDPNNHSSFAALPVDMDRDMHEEVVEVEEGTLR
jgi:hypothetical protein